MHEPIRLAYDHQLKTACRLCSGSLSWQCWLTFIVQPNFLQPYRNINSNLRVLLPLILVAAGRLS